MNELVSREDINKVAEMNNSALNVVVAQMTTLANAVVSGRDDIDCMVESLEKQPWYKRMWNTLTGKNKATKEEIAQKKDQMTGYLIQSVSGLYEMGKINQDIMVSLGQKINDIYYQVSLNSFEQLATKQSIIQLKDMVGKIAIALNEKIESVDNFNILNEQIKQGVYGNEKAVSAMCRIISNMDNRMLSDQRKVDIICRSMETAGIINDEDIAISDIMADIAAIAEDKTGEVYLELSSMNGNFWAGLFSELMEKYNLLPKMERMAKKKDVIIKNILDKNDIDESAAFSARDLYGSFIESRQEMAEMTSKARIEDRADNNTVQKVDMKSASFDEQSSSVNKDKIVSPFECQIKENDIFFRRVVNNFFEHNAEIDNIFDLFKNGSDDKIMFAAIIETELIYYYYIDEISKNDSVKLRNQPKEYIQDLCEKYRSDFYGRLLSEISEMIKKEYEGGFSKDNLVAALTEKRRDTLEFIYKTFTYQDRFNSITISRIIDEIFGKSKRIYIKEFYNKLVDENPESAAKILSIIHADMIFERCENYEDSEEYDEYDDFKECMEELFDQYLDSLDMELFDIIANYLFGYCKDYTISVDDLYHFLVKARSDTCYVLDKDLHYPIPENPVVISIRAVERDYDTPPIVDYRGNACDISLRNIEIEYGTRRIGKNAFRENYNIAKIIIPDTVEEIDDGAFADSCGNATIVIPGSIKKSSLSAFDYCGARRVIVSEGITELDSNGVLMNYVMAREIVLPDSLRYIGFGGLESCAHVKNIDFKNVSPFDVKVSDCSSLESVVFREEPDPCIEPRLPWSSYFQNCPNLKNLYFPKWYKPEYIDLIVKGICRDNKEKTPSDLNILYF